MTRSYLRSPKQPTPIKRKPPRSGGMPRGLVAGIVVFCLMAAALILLLSSSSGQQGSSGKLQSIGASSEGPQVLSGPLRKLSKSSTSGLVVRTTANGLTPQGVKFTFAQQAPSAQALSYQDASGKTIKTNISLYANQANLTLSPVASIEAAQQALRYITGDDTLALNGQTITSTEVVAAAALLKQQQLTVIGLLPRKACKLEKVQLTAAQQRSCINSGVELPSGL